MRVLVLCRVSQDRLPVIAVLQGQAAAFDLVMADTLSDFQRLASHEKFDAGLVDFCVLPAIEAKRLQVLRNMGSRIPLILLVTESEEGQVFRLLGAGVIRDYVVKSAGKMEKLPFALLAAQRQAKLAAKQAELSLNANEESFRNLFENSMVGITRTTPDGRILLANPALIRMLGFDSLEELQMRNLQQEGFTGEHPRNEFRELVEAMGELHGYETTWMRKDGARIYVRESARAVRGADNQTLYYDGVIEDITEQKQASFSLSEKVATLQALTEIDQDILAARKAGDILELVCRSAASLLKTPMAVVISTKWKTWTAEATFGVQFPEKLAVELQETLSKGKLYVPTGFAIKDIPALPEKMPRTVVLEGARSILAEMLLVGTVEHGILLVLDQRPRSWAAEETNLLKTLAGQAAIALDKAALLADAERRGDEFAALYDVSVGLSGERNLDSVLSLIVDSVTQLLQVPSAFIYFYDEKRDVLDLSIEKGIKITPNLTLKMGESMAGRVAATRKPLVVNDYRHWRYRDRRLDPIPYSAALEVPMLFGGNLIGVLGISEIKSNRVFTMEDANLLSLFAGQAASVVYNARLFEAIQKSNQELDRLYRASNALIGAVTANIADLSQKIAQIVISEFQHSNCSLWLLPTDSDHLQRGAIVGAFSSEFIERSLLVDGPGLIPKAVRTGQFVNSSDVLADPDYLAGWSLARSELVLPLKSGGRVIGALDVQSTEPLAFHDDDVRVLSQFASRASLMLEHARLVSETEQRLHRLSALHTVDIAVASSLDLQVTLKVFLEQVTSQLRVDAADVLLLNPHLQVLEYAAGRGFRGTGIRRVGLRIGEDAAGKAALDRTVVGISNIETESNQVSHSERIAGEGFVSHYAVPLIARGKIKGVMELFFRHQFKADLEWQNFVETLARQAAVAIDDAHLFEQLQRSYTELAIAYDSTIEGWARLLELRKVEPGGHSRHVSAMTVELARRLGVPEQELAHVHRGALLHDVGKLAISNQILLKPGSLTEEEWVAIRTHPALARGLLTYIDYLRPAAVIPYEHHEKWDGSGYPLGLAGEQISLVARIFSVVDVWDTLMRDQPYRPAWSEADATDFIRKQAGKHFDPSVVEVFLDFIQESENRSLFGSNDNL